MFRINACQYNRVLRDIALPTAKRIQIAAEAHIVPCCLKPNQRMDVDEHAVTGQPRKAKHFCKAQHHWSKCVCFNQKKRMARIMDCDTSKPMFKLLEDLKRAHKVKMLVRHAPHRIYRAIYYPTTLKAGILQVEETSNGHTITLWTTLANPYLPENAGRHADPKSMNQAVSERS